MRLKGFIHKAPVILSAVLIGIFMATRALATIYYVSTSGNNQTGDGSLNHPWARSELCVVLGRKPLAIQFR